MAPRAEIATSSHLVVPLLRYLGERGASIDLAGLGLPSAPTAETLITPRTIGALFDAVALALDEPHLGLVLPAALKFDRYELADLAVRSSPTLRESFQRLARYAPLLNEAVSFKFEERDGTGRFSHQVRTQPRAFNRHLNEFSMAMGVHEGRLRTGRSLVVREVCFVHARPRGPLDALVAYFGTQAIHFGHEENTLVFDGAILDAVQTTADPRLLLTAEGLAEAALKGRPRTDDGFRGVVEKAVREHLEQGGSIRTVALKLRMSTRTLQRRLESEGTSYAQLLDEVREALAREQVAAAEPSLSEVAFSLGFAEFATFSRAFKRWTGSPPGAFRAAIKTA